MSKYKRIILLAMIFVIEANALFCDIKSIPDLGTGYWSGTHFLMIDVNSERIF